MTRAPGKSRLRSWRHLALLALIVLAGILITQAASIVTFASNLADRSPSEVIRHVTKRLEGHTKLALVFLPPIRWVQAQIERPIPPGKLPTLGKGAQPFPLAALEYSADGLPLSIAMATPPARRTTVWQLKTASTAQEIIRTIETAKEGDNIEILPGVYHINQNIRTYSAGTQSKPIRVFASMPGQVTIEFSAIEGFHVTQPFWVFENLRIRGACKRHDDCEHAFHVVGRAKNIAIRNNQVEDFNAHVKVNGVDNHWPDGGLIQFNTLTNNSARMTAKPVTPVDIVGASYWSLQDNLISNFIKREGNQVSFGAFMKGAGHGGLISRNLVLCSLNNISQPGARVGLSFGGGGTDKANCRDQKCSFEHQNGRMANNIVAHCNDYGIDMNKSVGSLVFNNTLVNTSGISIRNPYSSARIEANLMNGNIRNLNDGIVQQDTNTKLDAAHFHDADRLALNLNNVPYGNSPPFVREDFCGAERLSAPVPGALTANSLCILEPK